MSFQRQEAMSAAAELAWHQQQLREGRLTYQEWEYHRDMISWLEQQRAAGEMQPHLRSQPAVRSRVREWSGRGHQWLPALLTWLKQI